MNTKTGIGDKKAIPVFFLSIRFSEDLWMESGERPGFAYESKEFAYEKRRASTNRHTKKRPCGHSAWTFSDYGLPVPPVSPSPEPSPLPGSVWPPWPPPPGVCPWPPPWLP